jgi:transposase
MANQHKHFTAEFKQDAVNYYYTSGKSSDQVAAELKVGKSTMGKWIRDAKNNSGVVPHRGSGNFSSDLEKENAKLKKELRDAQDALDILKKAISILND